MKTVTLGSPNLQKPRSKSKAMDIHLFIALYQLKWIRYLVS